MLCLQNLRISCYIKEIKRKLRTDTAPIKFLEAIGSRQNHVNLTNRYNISSGVIIYRILEILPSITNQNRKTN